MIAGSMQNSNSMLCLVLFVTALPGLHTLSALQSWQSAPDSPMDLMQARISAIRSMSVPTQVRLKRSCTLDIDSISCKVLQSDSQSDHIKLRPLLDNGNGFLKCHLRGGGSEAMQTGDEASATQHKSNVKSMLSSTLEEVFSENWQQDLGYICIGFGSFFLCAVLNPLPFFGLWMNRKGIILANLMLFAGSTLLLGAAEMRKFLLAGSRRLGTALMVVGFCVIWKDRTKRWTTLAFFVQLLGICSLFGPYAQGFFRFATQFIFPALLAIPRKVLLRR